MPSPSHSFTQEAPVAGRPEGSANDSANEWVDDDDDDDDMEYEPEPETTEHQAQDDEDGDGIEFLGMYFSNSPPKPKIIYQPKPVDS